MENITISDGLHGNVVRDVLQDSLGFLWLAGTSGLQKYDGHTFTFYVPDSSDPVSRDVDGLYEDNHDNLWIKMEKGLCRYRRESNDFVKYFFVNSDNDTVPYWVTGMAEDLNGTLWVWIYENGLYKINLENKNFTPHEKVNKWFQGINKKITLNESNRKGHYET